MDVLYRADHQLERIRDWIDDLMPDPVTVQAGQLDPAGLAAPFVLVESRRPDLIASPQGGHTHTGHGVQVTWVGRNLAETGALGAKLSEILLGLDVTGERIHPWPDGGDGLRLMGVDESISAPSDVIAGVPQGTMLATVWFTR